MDTIDIISTDLVRLKYVSVINYTTEHVMILIMHLVMVCNTITIAIQSALYEHHTNFSCPLGAVTVSTNVGFWCTSAMTKRESLVPLVK